MQRYKNLGGNSSVRYYETGNDFIRVLFSDGKTYVYTSQKAGAEKIRMMKILAEIGQGLNSYIMKNTRTAYSAKY